MRRGRERMEPDVDRVDERQGAVFFDLDDTLYDQLAPFRESVKEWVAPELLKNVDYSALFYRFRHHSDVLWEPYCRGELPLETMRMQRMALALAEFGIEADEQLCRRVQDAYLEEQGRVRYWPGVEACLAELTESGCLLGIITNGPKEHQLRKLEALGIEAYIPRERWFISGAVGLTKPDPALFEYVNRETGTLPAYSAYIGDSWANDVEGALGAGWYSIWFNSRGNAAQEGKAPHLIVSDYTELASLIVRVQREKLIG